MSWDNSPIKGEERSGKVRNVMIIRLAQKKDRKKILKIASHTWEGWDYVPQLLDEWLIEGGLFIAEEDG